MKGSSTPAQPVPLSTARSAGFAKVGSGDLPHCRVRVHTAPGVVAPDDSGRDVRRLAGPFERNRSHHDGHARDACNGATSRGRIADCRIGEMQERGAGNGSLLQRNAHSDAGQRRRDFRTAPAKRPSAVAETPEPGFRRHRWICKHARKSRCRASVGRSPAQSGHGFAADPWLCAAGIGHDESRRTRRDGVDRQLDRLSAPGLHLDAYTGHVDGRTPST
jgi:hypothetical protein